MTHRFPAIASIQPMKKRTLLGLAATLPLLMAAGCGGGDSGNDAQVRLLNASTGYASVDLYVDDDLALSGTAYGTLSSFSGVPNGDVTTVLTSNGSTTELLSQSRSLSAGENYTIIAYGWEGALKSVILQEDEAEADTGKTAADLEAIFDVPVQVSAVLGRSRMDVSELLRLGPGTVLELDRKVGEAIDIYVNNRLVARGEVVLVEEKLGVTMTEIIKADRG